MNKMSISRIAIASLLGALAAASASWAQTDTAGAVSPEAIREDTDIIAAASEIQGERPQEDTVAQRMRHWLDGEIWDGNAWVRDPSPANGRAISQQVEAHGGQVVQGSHVITGAPSSPDWSKRRANAYLYALNNARAQYIQSLRQSVTAEITQELMADTNVPLTYEPGDVGSVVEELTQKGYALANAKLDNLLRENGVDPEQYARAPESQRKLMSREALEHAIQTRSFGKLAGLMPVQTFDGYDIDPVTKKAVPSIGVICTISESSRQFAVDINANKMDFLPSAQPGKELGSYFRSQEDHLFESFGVRRMKDQDGYPVLVAFGQWGTSKRSSNATLNMRYVEVAQKQAEQQARSELAMFLNGNAQWIDKSRMGELSEEAAKVYRDGSPVDDNVEQLADILNEKFSASAEISKSGIRTLHTWSRPHPDYPDVFLCGAVLVWSPVYEKTARDLMKPVAPSRPSSQTQVPAAGTAAPAAIRSYQPDTGMDLSDF